MTEMISEKHEAIVKKEIQTKRHHKTNEENRDIIMSEVSMRCANLLIYCIECAQAKLYSNDFAVFYA